MCQEKWVSLYPNCPQWMRIADQSINQYYSPPVKLQVFNTQGKKSIFRHWGDKDREFIYKNLIWGDMPMSKAAEILGVSNDAIKNAWARTRARIMRGKYPGWTLPIRRRSGQGSRGGGKGSCCRRTEKRRWYIYNNLIWGDVSLQTAADVWNVSPKAIKKAWIRTRAAIRNGVYPGWKLPENRRNSKDGNVAI